MSTIITNGKFITWGEPNQIVVDKALYINNSKIERFGDAPDLENEFPEAQIINAHSQYIFPGLICSHTHFYGAFSKGLYIPEPAPTNFIEILNKLWWKLDKSLELEDVYYSALVCLIDAIKGGVTTLVDHHASPNAITGSLDILSKAIDESGLRGCLCYEVTDRDGPQRCEMGIQENISFIEKVNSGDNLNGRLAALFGLHASLTLSDQTLENCRSLIPENSGFHIHIAEGQIDQTDCLINHDKRVVERLQAFGILGKNTIAGHCVHVNPREIEILAETGTWVSHQPRSNSNNAVGLPEIEAMLNKGIPVCLGNDGFSNAMWEEWKYTYFSHKLIHDDPRRMNGNDVIKMGAYNNARLAAQLFKVGPIGIIEPGANADLIFVDYNPITDLTEANLPWHILFGMRDSNVTDTMVNGQFVMKDRKVLSLDEERITARARELSKKVWRRYAEQG
jgi:putative selenium metabolism protein SsnA